MKMYRELNTGRVVSYGQLIREAQDFIRDDPEDFTEYTAVSLVSEWIISGSYDIEPVYDIIVTVENPVTLATEYFGGLFPDEWTAAEYAVEHFTSLYPDMIEYYSDFKNYNFPMD